MGWWGGGVGGVVKPAGVLSSESHALCLVRNGVAKGTVLLADAAPASVAAGAGARDLPDLEGALAAWLHPDLTNGCNYVISLLHPL